MIIKDQNIGYQLIDATHWGIFNAHDYKSAIAALLQMNRDLHPEFSILPAQ
jgi:hypothetical protein